MSYDPTIPTRTVDRPLWTYKDTVEHLLDFIGGGTTEGQHVRSARRAADESLRELANVHEWSYFYTDGKVIGEDYYATGTVAFDLTGGVYERMWTLSSGTWPDWAQFGRLLVDDSEWPLTQKVSDSIVLGDYENSPDADVSSGTTYSLYRVLYPTPDLFVRLVSPLFDETNNITLSYIHPSEWRWNNAWYGGVTEPFQFTILGPSVGQYIGRSHFAFSGPVNDNRKYAFVYVRSPRPLHTEDYSTGTVSVTQDSPSLTGTGTVFTKQMIGSVVRLSSSSTTAPTGRYGSNPFSEERVIKSVESDLSATCDANFTTSRSGVKYCISDPVDIDHQVMLNAYLRTCEKNLATHRRSSDLKNITERWAQSIYEAKSADARYLAQRIAGGGRGISWADAKLMTATLGSDVE